MKNILSLVACGLLMQSSIVHAVSKVNPYNYHSLNVEGRGAVDIVTDSLKIDMTISNQSDCRGKTEDTCDGSDVQKKTSDMTQKLVQEMAKKDGVISISSGQVSLQPQTKFDNTLQTDVFTGFTSSIQLSAIVKGEIAGDFIDTAVQMGVNNIGGINYFVSDQVMKETQQKALELATQDAMAQSTAVLDVLGYKIKQVKSVNVPFIASPFKNNGPVDLDTANSDSSSLSSAVKTVGYVVKLKLKY